MAEFSKHKRQAKRHACGDILCREVDIPSAEVLTLFSATAKPVIIPAPGPNKINVVLAATVTMFSGTTDYATGTGSVYLAYKSGGDGAQISTSLADDIDQMTAGSVAIMGTMPEVENAAVADIVNQPVVLTMDTDDVDTGDRLLRVRVLYMILPSTT